ncbi:MAG TPA: hypothetical protein PKE56_01015 [Acidimicrobiales bacterium]|nr:hypothetical protein [Acidimicrobiales bacterium]
MTTPARLAAFGLAAVVALGGGAALGAAAGPAPTPNVHSDHEESPMPSTTLTPTTHTGHGDQPAAAADYRIDAPTTVIAAGEPQRFTFRVLDPAGVTVTGFEDRHDRPMHLIVVSNDLGDYAHLHPQLADGTWSVELPALEPGGYRVIADTVPTDGPDLVLTVDLVVPGTATGRTLPDPAGTTIVDDLSVTLDLTPTTAGLTAALSVRRDGALVEPDPYLGARGHLVAIDAEDLGYLHVHPTDGDGPVSFGIAEPAAGRYRLFFDFSVDGQVRTAAFTVDIDADPTTTPPTAADHGHTDGEGH